MGTKSSGHLKKSKAWNIYHNTDIRPKYRIGGALDFNHNAQEALALKQEIIKKAKEAYKRTRKPKAPPFKAQNYEWSLVVNLKESSTMQDLNKLAEFFDQKYGFQCYQIAIHRDEGHIDELGNRQINHHAHLEFISLDKETGKNRSRDIWNNHKKMSEMQDDIAQILQMEREPYQKGKVKSKRIEPRALAAIKEQEKQQRKAQISQNLTPKEISEVCENFRKSKKNLGYPKEFFRELSAIKKDTKESSKQELEILLEDLAKNYELQRQINQNLQEQQSKEREKEILEHKLIEQQKEINLLRQENAELKELFSIAMRKCFAQFIKIGTQIKQFLKEDLTNYAKRFTPSTQTTLQDIFKNAESNTQAPQESTQQTQASESTLSAQSENNTAATKQETLTPQSAADKIRAMPKPTQEEIQKARAFLDAAKQAHNADKAQESAQQGQSNATIQPNTQPTYKPKSRRR